MSGLKATDTDMYRCEIEVFYPPPYLELIGNGTLIHVLGKMPTRHADTFGPSSSLPSSSSMCFVHSEF